MIDDPLIGTTLEDRYEVVRQLGAGAMGAVYEVRHLRLNKRFAMKIISRALTKDPEFAARFEQEALSTSRLEHPNCIAVTDFGQTDAGLLYLVMEFLEGKPLSSLLDGPLPVGRALGICRQILLGLQHAHQAGVVHRDVKPENVMILPPEPGGEERVKVLDFGIAKLPLGARPDSDGSNSRLTEAGVVFGTPDYMAPEQALGSADVDQRADIYAAGVILWVMLTGRPLFSADNSIELLQTKLADDPPPLGKVCPGVFSPRLGEVVAEALARNPRERFTDASALLAAVDEVLAAPGGGLATDDAGEGPWVAVRARASELGSWTSTSLGRLGSAYVEWYRGVTGEGMPASAPSWPERGRGLVASSAGWVVLGSAVAALVLVGLVIALALGGGDGPTAPTTAVRGSSKAPAGASREPAPSARPARGEEQLDEATKKRLAVAGQLLARYACAAAAKDLRKLARAQPKVARGHYLLGMASLCLGRHAEGLRSYARALELDRGYQRDRRLLEDTGGLLTHRSKRTRRRALSFLEGLGQAARPQLLGATTSKHRDVRARAIAAVIRLGAADRIDWLTALHLDLKQLSCREIKRRRTVERLARIDDPRVRAILKRALGARAGLFRHRYRYACVRGKLKAELARIDGK